MPEAKGARGKGCQFGRKLLGTCRQFCCDWRLTDPGSINDPFSHTDPTRLMIHETFGGHTRPRLQRGLNDKMPSSLDRALIVLGCVREASIPFGVLTTSLHMQNNPVFACHSTCPQIANEWGRRCFQSRPTNPYTISFSQ